MFRLLQLVFVTCCSTLVQAQPIPEAPSMINPPPAPAVAAVSADPLSSALAGIRTPFELLLTLGILAFGLALVLVVLYMSTRAFRGSPELSSRLFTVVMIVTATLVLITAGYSNQQIAPVFGLFGTIVGYVLGRRDTTATIPQDGTLPQK